jgi:hypothetical protein
MPPIKPESSSNIGSPNANPDPSSSQPDPAAHNLPDQDDAIGFIEVKIRESARYQRETAQRVRRTDILEILMYNTAKFLGKSPEMLRFITWNGQIIMKDHTPKMVGGDLFFSHNYMEWNFPLLFENREYTIANVGVLE